MRFLRVLVLLPLLLALTACEHSPYSTKKNNYIKQSKVLPSIVVPPGANAPMQKPYYPIPAALQHVTTAGHPPSLKPPSLTK